MENRNRIFFALCFLSFIALPLVLVHLALPPFWGNAPLSGKLDGLKKKSGTYDRLFIGSSHIHWQLSPEVFDSVLNDGGRSFNLGVAGMFSPEGEQVCQYILEHSPRSLKEIYLEVCPFATFNEENLASCRAWYMVTPATWRYLVVHAWDMHHDRKLVKLNHTIGATKALTKALLLPGFVEQASNVGKGFDGNLLGVDGNGFEPLDSIQQGIAGERAQVRRVNFLRDTLVLVKRKALVDSFYAGLSDLDLSRAHLGILHNLMELGERKGVKVYFILPPLLRYPDPLPVFLALPEDRKFDLCQPSKYPQFYTVNNVFDVGHLNTRGSRLFTVAFANEVKRMREAGELRH